MAQTMQYNPRKRVCISINQGTYNSLRNMSSYFRGKQSFDSLINELISYVKCKAVEQQSYKNKQGAFEL